MADKKRISSGAEKAEKLTRKNSDEKKEIAGLADNAEGTGRSKASAKKTYGAKKNGRAQKNYKAQKKSGGRNTERSDRREARKRLREEKRMKHRKLMAEKKELREKRRMEHKEKLAERRALAKERRENLKEERRKRRDIIKNESKEARRERIAEERAAKREAAKAKREARLAERKAKREHRLKVRAQKRAARERKRDGGRTPGFGGWLAAVISLGVTTLALGTVLTFGWITMDGMQADMAGTYTQSLYELNSLVDELDTDLARAKASSSTADRVRVLADIAVESENAETVLERFPLEMQTTERLSSFINDIGGSARNMLYTVANGEELSDRQLEKLNYFYETNAKVKEELNSLMSMTGESDMLSAMTGDDSNLAKTFTAIQNNVFKEQGERPNGRKAPTPALLDGESEITSGEAEKLAKEYFSSYDVTEANCSGEVHGILPVYNVNLTTSDGEMLVQLSKAGGKVVSFDSYKDCSDSNFSVDRCVDIAEEFLESVGYFDLQPVWASEYGTTCNLQFAPVQDGAVIYSDLVKVKVCEERGIVTGLDAGSYVMRHREREIGDAAISEAEAKSGINGNIEVTNTRLALIPQGREERLCYEFFGEMDGVEYYVYVDAQTGEELEVKTIVGTAQGKSIL